MPAVLFLVRPLCPPVWFSLSSTPWHLRCHKASPARVPQNPASPATQDSGPNAGDVGQVMQDKMFLRKAAEGGIAEVKLGELAVQKGSSDEVKAFAQRWSRITRR